jgi:transposase-like protein
VGRSRGLARFRCKTCGRTFNALTKTPMAHLRKKERWPTMRWR